MADKKDTRDYRTEPWWQEFSAQEKLSKQQAEQFAVYLDMLIEWTTKINLTAITEPEKIVLYHFQDSLRAGHAVDFSTIKAISDIGAGEGFPGIPLQIKYPQVALVLIEVNNKKIMFLQEVIQALQLQDVDVYPLDWRTFLRKTSYEIDLFLARASLQPEELLRMFKPGSPYKHATLIYWAAKQWEAEQKLVPFVEREEPYTVGDKKRKLVFFALK